MARNGTDLVTLSGLAVQTTASRGFGMRTFVLISVAGGATALLEKMRRRTWSQEQIRKVVWTIKIVTILGDLMQEQILGQSVASSGALTADPVKRFEFYLSLACEDMLSEVVSLARNGSPVGRVAYAASVPTVRYAQL